MRHSSFNQVNSSTNLSVTNDTVVQMDKIRDKKMLNINAIKLESIFSSWV